ncbi:hypothetical protein [Nocardia wallacei]|uniref:PIN domain-containing protein n=1 Tax=Nocardia wallacei TaxID=480035 RepID=A0A7G1KQE2_9NOCA|nr:hypothetical protein [Nocardia wallacei]BCK57495.1 hypothetical protein NWFMUON74_52670 [Nocardia wallacei]
MSAYLFPDVTVVRSYAMSGRLDTLRSLLHGRGRWTAATAFEAGRTHGASTAIASIVSQGWLGEPLEISDPDEIQQVQLRRRAVFGGHPDDPLSRLSEAETWHVLREWAAYADGILVTDDPALLQHAHRWGVRTQRTMLSPTLREPT